MANAKCCYIFCDSALGEICAVVIPLVHNPFWTVYRSACTIRCLYELINNLTFSCSESTHKEPQNDTGLLRKRD